MMRLASLSILLATTSTAFADERTNAVSVQLATLDTAGLAVQGEHDLGAHRLSLALVLGGRTGAHGDYDSLTLGAGVELRYWFRNAMRGWYTGVRTDLARTRLEDTMDDRTIGSLTTASTGLTLGYRIVIKDRVELTPSIGTGFVVESGMDGRSPITARGYGTVGFTAGVMF